MRVIAAGLLLALAREATGAGCPVTVPAGQWPQGAWYKAVSAGKTNVSVPRKWDGFNRTVTIDGFCADTFSISTNFQCVIGPHEFRMLMPQAVNLTAPVALRFGPATCPLTGIGLYKTPQGKFPAEMRFEFEGCQAAPLGTAAVVVVGVREDVNDLNFNLLPWTQEVCIPKSQTTKAPSQVNFTVNTIFMKVPCENQTECSSGICDAIERRKLNRNTEEGCKSECQASGTKAHILNGTGCTGFSFYANAPDGEQCVLFSGIVTKAKKSDGYSCYNMTFNDTAYAKVTPPPPPAVKDTSELLAIREVLGLSAAGYLQQISPPADAASCSPAWTTMWWFTLEDRQGNPLSVPASKADLDALKAILPDPLKTENKTSAAQVIDRVIVDTCTVSDGWGAQMCFVPPVVKTECRSEEITGAIISGVITCILTWIFVACWFCFYLQFAGSKAGYNAAAADESGRSQGSRICEHTRFFIGMVVVALGGSNLASWISMKFLDAVMRSSECYSNNEFLVVAIAICQSVSLGIIIFSWYMKNYHPAHPHPLLQPEVKPEISNKLMLIEAPPNAQTGNHPMTALDSYNTGSFGGPGASQNSGSFSAFNTVRPGATGTSIP